MKPEILLSPLTKGAKSQRRAFEVISPPIIGSLVLRPPERSERQIRYTPILEIASPCALDIILPSRNSHTIRGFMRSEEQCIGEILEGLKYISDNRPDFLNLRATYAPVSSQAS
jgi:hypothetical protein